MDKLITISEVEDIIGLKKSKWYELQQVADREEAAAIKAGLNYTRTVPATIKIGGAARWSLIEIQQFVALLRQTRKL